MGVGRMYRGGRSRETEAEVAGVERVGGGEIGEEWVGKCRGGEEMRSGLEGGRGEGG